MMEFIIANRLDKYRGYNRTEKRWATAWVNKPETVEKLINILYGEDNVSIVELPSRLHSTSGHHS